jgi:hypothetical protein
VADGDEVGQESTQPDSNICQTASEVSMIVPIFVSCCYEIWISLALALNDPIHSTDQAQSESPSKP